jgi:hypothetical protein
MRSALFAFPLLLVALNCGTKSEMGFADPSKDNDSGTFGGSSGFGASGGSDAAPMPIGTVTGKVVAPEGTIPLSGALIYLTSAPPGPIPSGAYCDKCVQLDSYAFTYSNPDGTFSLPVYSAGKQYIVTQKGQFRRVREFDAKAGPQSVQPEITRLPGRNDASTGDTIPRMKVMSANWDSIAKSLRKLGVTEFVDGSDFGDKTLSDVNEASKYHVIFIPCNGQVNPDFGGGAEQCSGIYAPGNNNKQAMREYVAKGGKLYVTDWSYEYVRQTWPGFVKFTGETSAVGSACTIGEYSGPAQWDDPELGKWMTAIGEGSAELKKSYVSIASTSPQMGKDENGAAALITPKVWASTKVNGRTLTSTVSFQDTCGRVMYSTYHAEGTDHGGGGGLLAQEKALFHILLEVSACVGVKPVPPR